MDNQLQQDSILDVKELQSKEDNIMSDDLNVLLNEYNIDKNKYIVPAFEINYYNKDYVIGNIDLNNLICPICYNILKNPISCSLNQNSHTFCKECIDISLEVSDACPICKNYFEYIPNFEIENILQEINFKCIYYKEGCSKILKYSEYFSHIKGCEYKKIIYECKIDKYNYIKKQFDKCSYRGYINEIDKHFKICGLLKYKCIFCNKYILKINLKEHLENTFNISIINFSEGDKYVGEIKNGKSEGYGIDYYLNGDQYEGDFKNNLYEGYGVFNYLNLDRYEGEFKNGKAEGLGVFYNSNGTKYEGEFKNGIKDGYGIEYHSNRGKFEGEFFNDLKDGFGILNFNNGELYIGEFYNDLKDGYGIFYYANGDNYKGEYKNDLRDGFGIYNFAEGDIYEGEFKNDLMEGYGIINYNNGDIYKGELINGKAEGYGIIYYSNGDSYAGIWKNGDIEGTGIDNLYDNKNEEGLELYDNKNPYNYFGLFKLYFYRLIKFDKSFIIKILSLIFIIYFLILKS